MHALAEKIETLRRRMTARRRAAAACWTIATVLAAALLLGALDYWLRYVDLGLRVLATAALAAAAGWAAYRWWYLPRRHPVDALSVARRVETRFPQLGDALASSLEFLQQAEEDATAGSAQLRRIVIAETETAVAGLQLADVIDRQPLKRAAIWAGAALAAVAVCLVIDAGAVGTAVARLIAPFGDAQWPREHYLEFSDPPRRLAVGQTFEAKLVDRSGRLPVDVRVEYRILENGRHRTVAENAPRSGDSVLVRRENVRESFSFRAAGGDDRAMRWIYVEVVEPPRLESIKLTVHPPSYSGLPATAGERYLEVLEGSRIEVVGTASAPLAGARILAGGAEVIAAGVGEAAGDTARQFRIDSNGWVATKSGSYELELASRDGVVGIAASWQLRVLPDLPPSIAWRQPGDDLFVLPSAVVPIELVVKDDLAIRSVDVLYERSNHGGAANEGGDDSTLAKSGRLEFYHGPEQAAGTSDEARIVEGQWSLAPLGLKPGDALVLQGEASDYRPAASRTSAPRRLAIITVARLDARLVEKQTEIVRQLEKTLSIQQATREEVRRVAIQQADGGQLSSGERNALAAAELNQRRVRELLTDASAGLPAMIDALVAELTMNGVDNPDIERAMRGLRATLGELANGPLDAAERELTAARKEADALAQRADDAMEAKELPPPQFEEAVEQEAQGLSQNRPGEGDSPIFPRRLGKIGTVPDDIGVGPKSGQSDRLNRSLSTVEAAQEEVITVVERLAAELSDAADYERYIRQLSELRTDQINHERTTRGEIDPETLPLQLAELTRDQRANLNQAAAGQDAILNRYEKIMAGLRRLSTDLDLQDAAASNMLRDAVALGERLSIAVNMQEASRDVSENRVGRGLDLEQKIAVDLEAVLIVLRKRAPQHEERLNELKRAEAELNQLREQVAMLRQELAAAEAAGNRATGERERLGRQQEELRRSAEELARRIERLQAAGAARSAQQAADRLDNRPPRANRNAAPQPTRPEQVQEAEQKLAEAARELAEERAKAELDVALEFINRFRAELERMIARQRTVIADTEEIDTARQAAGTLSASDTGRLEQLAAEERALAELADQHRALLSSLTAVRISLEEARRRLGAAAELLLSRQAGVNAQQAERHALARLEAMGEAFAQTAADARKPPEGGNRGGGNQGAQPQRRPAFELLEVKMLRMLQVELNERTKAYQQRLAEATGPPNDSQRVELAREAQDLAAEQRRLAELVQEMLSRNNGRHQDEER